jgi:hypothetical protein
LYRNRYIDFTPDMALETLPIGTSRHERAPVIDGIRTFQRARGLESNGCPDRETLTTAGVLGEDDEATRMHGEGATPPAIPPRSGSGRGRVGPMGGETTWVELWLRGGSCATRTAELVEALRKVEENTPAHSVLEESCRNGGDAECTLVTKDLQSALNRWRSMKGFKVSLVLTRETFRRLGVVVPASDCF